MNDTMVTLVGNVATAVEHRETPAGVPVARFRMATTSRRWDRARECWTDGETSFYTVRSWRALADNVAASVAVGEPVVVQGRLRLREGEQPPEKGGGRWFAAEIDALAIGHDLARGTSAFRRVVRARKEGDATQLNAIQPSAIQPNVTQPNAPQPPGPQADGPPSPGGQPAADPWQLEKPKPHAATSTRDGQPAPQPTLDRAAASAPHPSPPPPKHSRGRPEDPTEVPGRAASPSGNSGQKVSVP
ncbi:single-stranded DNA-binding protein [Streptomyces sp. NRRL F-4489]|uniref:single-stranded DNA-binding protein n=1 Tax=Streptomyces sp. NRRL F-4489 TaxID=1609095 RepID=UPI00099E8283|nr:single-stranded DNA-binding protein [Streptomyces sp. NRRL F-4489]